jgi:hypothetical protein
VPGWLTVVTAERSTRRHSGCGLHPIAAAGERQRMFEWLARRRHQAHIRRLRARHLHLLEAARDLQRGGDIQQFAARTAEAEAVAAELEALENGVSGDR